MVALGGLMLWIGKGRRDRRMSRLATPDPAATGRSRVMSWHAVIGVWVLLGVLALSVSGLTWSRFAGANIGEVRTALSWTEPTPATSLHTGGASDEHAHHGSSGPAAGVEDPDAVFSDGAGVDGVLAAARDAGLGDPLYLVPPADGASAWTAAENKRDWPTGYDAISVDPATGKMLDRVDFADWPVMAKLTDWVIGAHMGILFGIANQLALAALAIGLIVMTLLGYRMWWLRRPRGASRLRFGRPVPRGASAPAAGARARGRHRGDRARRLVRPAAGDQSDRVSDGRRRAGRGASAQLSQEAAQAAQRPKISTVWLTSVKPFCAATLSAQVSTAGPSISTALPQLRQTRWW